ncbi:MULTISPECIES: 4-(cytidine 5'-diphospho)-2-C-methyl-D-erythritol kinase [Halomonadaceae]|uniref:4-diphosphocytidyl-2-C-methyl-D-erythritol kinase n=1 Tax=Vreelandella piezotolerans TaxID=2609667 RepID=A0ABQ6XES6_9GAMM|nr:MULTISPECIES: 4-(cytidine 5'-diphospho)-2-C-methyl-D-erythritol kinase [Halomonas]KAE8440137.1 4-(cytidine 5'-diphospho)-2-C-methyl-D-erythritol kinase [Halomonas piezotolerans]MCG7576744.1 4-(cytidine 5'-diphospho)-2-C-methyl-D-erythritol kinase [Halomonas sp. MMH1-48]MCG7590768.1 4-(cytidine 5'-diphospho)-2-C-methyl-D-erythritol kinase [Halomonas sp. McD50-5]MCG7603807.1 4-(cytidine 5'-diphospho)-2-C-methyl-D-erythritol kinase [Halomonas sp. MM17-34]MCG7613057.1 4-(cytidine 5'-diphospho)-
MSATPQTLTLPAPAKLNRMLHIVGRRPDGYHELQTLFQFIDLCDYLSFTLRQDGIIELTTPIAGVAHDDNLIVRAATLLQQASGTHLGATISIEKRLPMGGGLGGGSSNAATALKGLDRLWQLGLGDTHLAELGLALGADVPVFVRGRSAWAEGVGEKLTPVTLDTPWFVVIHPGISVSTPAIFQDSELTRDSLPITMARALQGGVAEWRNDCEATVKKRYPHIAEALDWLAQHAPSRLTGTGACLFAAFESKEAAQTVAELANRRWQAWVARGLNTSPLQDALGC